MSRIASAADRAAAMAKMLTALVGDEDWSLIGRTMYRRGQRGTFKLEPWSGGYADHVTGLVGTYTANTGAIDRIEFRFGDLIKSSNPTGNPHYQGEAVVLAERDWDWHIAKPDSIRPFHAAIDAWLMTWEITAAELDEMTRDDAKAVRRRASKAGR